MNIKNTITAAASLALAAGLAGGLATQASASTVPVNNTRLAASTSHVTGAERSAGSTVNGLDSLNWAGYVHTHASHVASANWTVASVWGPTGYAASWVGLDGWSSQTVEQTGIDSAVFYGQQIDTAWVELYPAGQQFIVYAATGSEVPVYPGDRMGSSVTAIGGGYYAIRLTDYTRGWHFAGNVYDRAGRNASAEAIMEAPESAATGNILPLADFGSVSFTGVNVSGYATKATMVARNWRVKASVTGSQWNFTTHFEFAGLAP